MEYDFKKKLGFGCMRLPQKDGHTDLEETKRMVDEFLKQGFIYFDTAHGYLDGESEKAIKSCLTSRYGRDRYVLTDKLTAPYFKKEEDIRPFFMSQLEACGVSYFDFYLMHAQGQGNYEHFQSCHAYETAFALKKEGKIRHVGISFHDTPEFLEKILSDHPEIEVVQIQLNYVDFDDPAIQSGRLLEVANRHHKPIIVMEPVKGGNLARLPVDAKKIMDDLHGGSPASYAIRFAASQEGTMMILSGMSDLEQMEDNLSFMKDFQPLTASEMGAIENVKKVFRSKHMIPCTACHYCVAGCPKHIKIPDLFALKNSKDVFHDWNADFYYRAVHTGQGHGKASECLKCGACEKVCPQHLKIRELLVEVAKEFEK